MEIRRERAEGIHHRALRPAAPASWNLTGRTILFQPEICRLRLSNRRRSAARCVAVVELTDTNRRQRDPFGRKRISDRPEATNGKGRAKRLLDRAGGRFGPMNRISKTVSHNCQIGRGHTGAADRVQSLVEPLSVLCVSGLNCEYKWRRPGSNRQPQACKACALPIELRPPTTTCEQTLGSSKSHLAAPPRQRWRFQSICVFDNRFDRPAYSYRSAVRPAS